jgi:zinc transport system substrate-binding protein
MRVRSVVLLGAVTLAAVPACSAVDAASGPAVVAGLYPYAFVAERVAGEHLDVANLTDPGVEPHDLELSPRQVAEISEADLVIYDARFQPAVADAVEQNPPGQVLDIAEIAEPSDIDETHQHEHETTEEGHAHADLEGDPHLWQNPTQLIPIVERVASDLAEIDPDQAADFRANAETLTEDLTTLDEEISSGLANCERRTFVTSHAAFGHFADRYDLEMVPIAGLTPDIEPSPQQLAEVQELVEQEGITTVFSERLGSQAYADTLADEVGVETAVLDPIEGLSDEETEADYFSLMRDNLAALQKANGCS